jgi:hypothetical protein
MGLSTPLMANQPSGSRADFARTFVIGEFPVDVPGHSPLSAGG